MDHHTIRTIVDSLPLPLVATDRAMRVLAANHAGLILLGQPSLDPSVIGPPLLDLVPASEQERFRSAAAALDSLPSASAPHSAVTFDILRRTTAGERHWPVTVTRLLDPDAGAAGYLFASCEIGAFPDTGRRAEQEEARMDVARQLAATLNHEINNPLFVVSATLEDLLAEASDPAEQRRLKAALDAVWRVSSSVKKLSEIRQLVSTAYIEGLPMIDLEASQLHPDETPSPRADTTS